MTTIWMSTPLRIWLHVIWESINHTTRSSSNRTCSNRTKSCLTSRSSKIIWILWIILLIGSKSTKYKFKYSTSFSCKLISHSFKSTHKDITKKTCKISSTRSICSSRLTSSSSTCSIRISCRCSYVALSINFIMCISMFLSILIRSISKRISFCIRKAIECPCRTIFIFNFCLIRNISWSIFYINTWICRTYIREAIMLIDISRHCTFTIIKYIGSGSHCSILNLYRSIITCIISFCTMSKPVTRSFS